MERRSDIGRGSVPLSGNRMKVQIQDGEMAVRKQGSDRGGSHLELRLSAGGHQHS